jgi:hypothetical protein
MNAVVATGNTPRAHDPSAPRETLGEARYAVGAAILVAVALYLLEVAARSSRRSGWAPSFVGYLYLSITNSSAFSPTDTMPLSPRAKMLMSIQSLSALVLMVIVIARGVNVLR